MNSERLAELTVSELGRLLRKQDISPVELTKAYLYRIKGLDGSLNTFSTVMSEEALLEAQAAEEAIARGEWIGPLHGIPFGIKDLFDVKGVPNTAGSRILKGNRPTEDATVIQRLRAAGAIILGKQTMHEFAFGVTSENPHYGPVRNPRDPSRITGGSSGGTAAAIAAGLCAAGLGTDTGGSIRIPAALCGVAGIKPTYGRVSRRGVVPLAWSLDHVGPLGRSVMDLALILQAIAGPDPLDPSTLGVPVPDFGEPLDKGVRGLRLGVPREYFWDVIEPGVSAAVQGAIRTLEGLGAHIEEISLPSVLQTRTAFPPIIGAEAACWHEYWLTTRSEEYGDDVRRRLQDGARVLAAEYLRAQRIRSTMQTEFAAVLSQVDAIVVPTVPIVAPKIGETLHPSSALGEPPRAVINRNTSPINLVGLPAATVPCGESEGLPVGLHVIGAAWQEPMVLRIAHTFEREFLRSRTIQQR